MGREVVIVETVGVGQVEVDIAQLAHTTLVVVVKKGVNDHELGRIGLLSCMDGLIPETARVLAVKGADIILNSLCSNGLDEAHTHIPARAAENGVYVIAANRIGDMVQGADLQRLIDAAGMDREKVKGAGESQLKDLPQGMFVETLGDDFDSGADAFLDTAAVMKCCDLVITCDTAITVLGGALGVPTWIMLKLVPHWFWMLDRPDSPWYPTLRLFRQKVYGDWSDPFREMETALAEKMGER